MDMRHLAQRSTPWVAAVTLALAASGQTPTPATAKAKPQTEFDALEAEFDAAWKAYRDQAMAAIKAADEAEEPRPEFDRHEPVRPFIPRFREGAEKHAGTDQAVPYLIWLVDNCAGAEPSLAQTALDTLADDHVASAELQDLGRQLGGVKDWLDAAQADALLAKFEAGSTVADVRGWATFGRHFNTLSEAALDSTEYATARETLSALDESLGRGMLARRVQAEIGLREQFALGMVAPDIVGMDLDGVEFKLSDYAGKVVFLDFWGDW
ncbi:MAG: hypothetical protein AAF628_14765 [Planctomycetota bacterium]